MSAKEQEQISGMFFSEDVQNKEYWWVSKKRLISIVVCVLGLILFIVGIALLAFAVNKKCGVETGKTAAIKIQVDSVDAACEFSQEAKRVGLGKFLDDVKTKYYELHPQNIVYNPTIRAEPDRVKREYYAYDPLPSAIKRRTDTALRLLEEVNDAQIDRALLKPRERKALSQVKNYLKHTFGQPYDGNYYSGDWMLGPTSFCWQPICYQGYDIYNAIYYHKPYDLNDIHLLLEKLKSHRNGTLQYIDNLRLGVKSGMVRSVHECVAGLDAIKQEYLNVYLTGNATGVFTEWYVKALFDPKKMFFENITETMEEEWKKDHRKSVAETVKDGVLEYFGQPIHELMRYLEYDHIRHCVPSNVSSGLAGLPLNYVYVDGKPDVSQPTNPRLPTGEPLDGKKAYENIMPYFTTNNMSPEEVHDLGNKQLQLLYPLAVGVAREMTGINNSDDAVLEFRKKLNSSESYFNDRPIPQNESNKEAHTKCSTPEDAEKYCPTRWKTLMRWFKESSRVMSMLDPKTVDMFYFTGEKHTTPNCPVEMKPDLNPSSAAQSYSQSDPGCRTNAAYYIPFFLDNMGPIFSDWTTVAHEARPGHHTQGQGFVEHFQDTCGGTVAWLDGESYSTAFGEGWALYAENPLIAEETDMYDDEPMQKYGMLQWQIWRALRLIVDTGLHFKSFSREKALWYFNEYAWDSTDLARKEVTRYQSNPGQATAYMIGQLDIRKARTTAENALGEQFNLRDFHYQVLSQGAPPLDYLAEHINKYVACVLKAEEDGCDLILGSKERSTTAKTRKTKSWPIIRPAKRHHI